MISWVVCIGVKGVNTMDNQTMKDYIEDLLLERASLYEQLHKLQAELEQLRAAQNETLNH